MSFFLPRLVVNAIFLCRMDPQIIAKSCKMFPKGARGYPYEGPERSKTAQEHPRAPQETPRDDQKASLRAWGSPLEALWRRLERLWGVLECISRPFLELKVAKNALSRGLRSKSLAKSYFLHFSERFWMDFGPIF